MKGVVLCGGNSTRMGTDKGLLQDGNRTWAELAADKLASLNLPVVVSLNENQSPSYSCLFTKEVLVVDNTVLIVNGPLLGLLSVHSIFPEEDLLVLACDIKDMKATLLQNLLDQSAKDPHEATVYANETRRQPLCGIYTAKGLKKIYAMVKGGELKRFSMMHVLELLDTKNISISYEDLAAFNNYNSAEQL
jgi:molybdopterin-guanine dinucleotide biosynthesis protein A